MATGTHRFVSYAWTFLAATVAVILWGGIVRATGSGAGCGAHWPLCNGEVVPHAPAVATLIEFGHRLSSALLGLMAAGLVIWAFRAFPRGSGVRRAAAVTGFLVIVEALIGAGLVLFEYVAFDPRIARAYWMGAHLTNTFLLLGAATLTAWRAGQPDAGAFRPRLATWVALVATLLLGVSGAITALGDTLAIHGGLDPAQNAVVGALVGLRLYHPILAGLVLLAVAWSVDDSRRAGGEAQRYAIAVLVLFVLQMGLGLLNVALHAPVWLQIVHLLVTDLIWIGLVLSAASARVRVDARPAGVVA
jgi:heme A synthase